MIDWTPEEDAYLKQVGRTLSAVEIAKRLYQRFGNRRTKNVVMQRRAELVPDHAEEPIGYVRLVDVAWVTSGSRQPKRKPNPFIHRRAIEDGVMKTMTLHGRDVKIVPVEWADRTLDEMVECRNNWLSTEEVAAILGIPSSERALNRFEAATTYPALQSVRRIWISRRWMWNPDDIAKAAEEIIATRDRHRWLRKNWWNTKTAAEQMRISVDTLRGLATNQVRYWGAPTSMLVREVGSGGAVYYEPESVRAFTDEMDKRRNHAKKKVGVDEAPT